MNIEWIVTGMILFGGMTAAGISLYVKRRRESQADLSETGISPDLAEPEKEEK